MLVVTHNYPRFPGDPAGAFVARLARGVAVAGWKVRVVAPHAPGLAESLDDAGVRVGRFRYGPDSMETVAYSGELHRRALDSITTGAMVPWFLFRFRRAVRRAVEEHRPDVIHAHWWLPSGLVAASGSVPLVITCHGTDVRLLDRPSFRRLGRWVLERADLVTAVSGFLAENLRKTVPKAADRVVVAPMPVETAHWIKAAGEVRGNPPVILFAGNLLPSKGVDVLLDAARLLADRGVLVGLRIVGQGPARDDLMARATRLGLTRISWSDFVDQAGMVREYAAATTVVLPTRDDAEGLGLVLVEGLLAGCAVVGARSGGIPDVIEDGVTGRLVPPDDPAALAGAIADTLNADLRRGWIAEGQRRVIDRYGADRVVASFLGHYDRLARRPG